jgi:copper(I)-binding protein
LAVLFAAAFRCRFGAVFMEINNNGASNDRLIGGSTPVAATVEVHALWMTRGGRVTS